MVPLFDLFYGDMIFLGNGGQGLARFDFVINNFGLCWDWRSRGFYDFLLWFGFCDCVWWRAGGNILFNNWLSVRLRSCIPIRLDEHGMSVAITFYDTSRSSVGGRVPVAGRGVVTDTLAVSGRVYEYKIVCTIYRYDHPNVSNVATATIPKHQITRLNVFFLDFPTHLKLVAWTTPQLDVEVTECVIHEPRTVETVGPCTAWCISCP